ncbi:hypothetical protein AH835_08215 [Salmonella enterica]|nr:hypothetical protein [Salmonella enterica]
MDEKIKILMPCQVPSLHDDVDLFSIGRDLNFYVKDIQPFINISDLGDWSILIQIVSRPTNGIGVYKRIKRYPMDKEFEISISIAIPDDKQAVYGSKKVNEGFFLPLDNNGFYLLNVDFGNCTDLYAGQDHENRDANHDFHPGFSLLL